MAGYAPNGIIGRSSLATAAKGKSNLDRSFAEHLKILNFQQGDNTSITMTSQPAGRIIVKLEVDWNAGPFWVSIDGEPADSYDVDEVGEFVSFSDDLLRAISAWDQRFQERMNWDDPNTSDFFTPEEQAAFDTDGRVLASRIRSEVPTDIEIRYKPFGPAPYEVISGATPGPSPRN
ncbi:MAG TPA: hypothetical protein VF444_07710 [Pseudonocardiaceae bacterium]